MTAAATNALMAAKTTFSTATAPMGKPRANRRSSISLLYENSMTNGSTVLCRPVRTAARATRAGEQYLLVAGPGVPEFGEDLAEHEQEEQRLEDDLGQEPPGTRGR